MGIEDVMNQGKDLIEKNAGALSGLLKSDQAEAISDTVLDGAANLAKKVAPGASAQIDGVRNTLDGAIGNE